MATSRGKFAFSWRTGVLAGSVGFFLAGCSPGDPLDTKVEAGDAVGFAMWQSNIVTRLTPEQVETMNKALQEIRFHIMSNDRISGHAALEAALDARIDGQPLRQVLRQGLSWERERAHAEWAALAAALNRNGISAGRAAGQVSVDYQRLHEHQLERLHAAADEVALTEARLAATGPLDGP